MPLFYFHLATPSGVERDEIGINCPDVESAYLEAHRAIPEIAAALLKAGTNPMRCQVEIENRDGELLFSVPFKELIAP